MRRDGTQNLIIEQNHEGGKEGSRRNGSQNLIIVDEREDNKEN